MSVNFYPYISGKVVNAHTDFGVPNDGATDATSAIQEMADNLPEFSTVVFTGKIKVRDQVTITTANLTFMGYGSQIIGGADQSAADVLFSIQASGFSAHGFQGKMDVRVQFFKVDAETLEANLTNFKFTDIYCEDAFYTVDIRGDATYSVKYVDCDNVTHIGTSGQNNAAIVAFNSSYVSYINCFCRYAKNSAAFVQQECSYLKVIGCSTEDTATSESSDASIEIENCDGAFGVVSGNVCDYRIYIDDSTDITIGPNIASHLRFTVESRSQTSISATGGTYGGIQLDDIGVAGSYVTNANFSGITLDPAHYSNTYGIFAVGEWTGEVQFSDIRMVSNGSSANVLLGRHANATYIVKDCDFNGGTVTLSGSGGTVNIRGCVDYKTENSGTGSITSGSTSDVITHGLSVTPSLEDIIITGGENPTNSTGNIWVDTLTSTQFTVNCENDPGASNFDFGWKAIVTRDL